MSGWRGLTTLHGRAERRVFCSPLHNRGKLPSHHVTRHVYEKSRKIGTSSRFFELPPKIRTRAICCINTNLRSRICSQISTQYTFRNSTRTMPKRGSGLATVCSPVVEKSLRAAFEKTTGWGGPTCKPVSCFTPRHPALYLLTTRPPRLSAHLQRARSWWIRRHPNEWGHCRKFQNGPRLRDRRRTHLPGHSL